MPIDLSFRDKLIKVDTVAMLDTGADENFIAYDLLRGADWEPPSKPLAPIKFVDGTLTKNYGTVSFDTTITDMKGKQRTRKIEYVIINMTGFDVILGKPWLYEEEPMILSFKKHQWKFRIKPERDIIFQSPKRFSKATRDEEIFLMVASVVEEQETPNVPLQYRDYEDVFSAEEASKLPSEKVNHEIQLRPGAGSPPYGPLYPCSATELNHLRQYLEEMQQKGWIRESTSPAGAPVLFVKKADGSLRVCVDYRGLNEITVKNRYPLPRIDEMLDRLVGSNIFTKIDLRDAYHRIRIRRGDEWKTAFRTRYGHFEYLVMPFGLTNAPATFQSYIHQAMKDILDDFVIVYLDDILIFSKNEHEHIKHVQAVLRRLRKANLYAKLTKCDFHKKELKFLGYLVNEEGVSMDPDRIATIQEWPVPKSDRDIRVFLGFTGFFRKFIRNYSTVTAPMTDLLKQAEKKPKKLFIFTREAQQAFEELKRMFSSPPVVRHFDPEKEILIITDASKWGRGAILLQPAENMEPTRRRRDWQPVAFISQKFDQTQQNWKIHDQELGAIVFAFEKWRHYLEGSKYTIRVQTDHNNLQYFFKAKTLNSKQARWAQMLAAYDFQIEYKPGKTNPADPPSRRPDYLQEGEGEADIGLLPTLQQKLKLKKLLVLGMKEEATGTPPGRRRNGAGTHSIDFSGQDVPSYFPIGKSGSSYEKRRLYGADIPYMRGNMSEISSGKSPESIEPSRFLGRLETEPSGHSATGSHSHQPSLSPSSRYDANKEERSAVIIAPISLHCLSSDNIVDDEPLITAESTRHFSRLLVLGAAAGEDPFGYPSSPILDLIRTAQKEDALAVEKLSKIQGLEKPENESQQSWSLKEGTYYYEDKIYVPESTALRSELMKRHHDHIYAGHFGVSRTLELLRRKYYWPGMNKDIAEYVQTCEICQLGKVHRHKPYGELQSLPVAKCPGDSLSMDFITDLPPSRLRDKTYDSILVVVDRFTKYSFFIPAIKTVSAEQFADIIIDQVYHWIGYPNSVISDRGSIFTSKYWSTLCYLLGTKRKLSTTFHPQTDGQTERMNQVLEHYLRTYCNQRQDNWASLLSTAQFVCNNSLHTGTGTTPNRALMGYDPKLPFEEELSDPKNKSENQTASDRAEIMEHDREILIKNLKRAAESQAKYYNKKHKPKTYNVGDQVLLSLKNIRSPKRSKKLDQNFEGPFEILERIGRQAYRLDLGKWKKRIHPVFHVSLLEPYRGRPGAATRQPDAEINEEGFEEWEVEAIVAHRTRRYRGKTVKKEYLIKWKGYPSYENSWEPRANLKNAKELLDEYGSKQ